MERKHKQNKKNIIESSGLKTSIQKFLSCFNSPQAIDLEIVGFSAENKLRSESKFLLPNGL